MYYVKNYEINSIRTLFKAAFIIQNVVPIYAARVSYMAYISHLRCPEIPAISPLIRGFKMSATILLAAFLLFTASSWRIYSHYHISYCLVWKCHNYAVCSKVFLISSYISLQNTSPLCYHWYIVLTANIASCLFAHAEKTPNIALYPGGDFCNTVHLQYLVVFFCKKLSKHAHDSPARTRYGHHRSHLFDLVLAVLRIVFNIVLHSTAIYLESIALTPWHGWETRLTVDNCANCAIATEGDGLVDLHLHRETGWMKIHHNMYMNLLYNTYFENKSGPAINGGVVFTFSWINWLYSLYSHDSKFNFFIKSKKTGSHCLILGLATEWTSSHLLKK